MTPAAIRAVLSRYPSLLLRRAAQAFRRLPDARDREAMHDFRVALRRLRVWLRYGVEKDVAARALAQTLGELARGTNRARDLEIEIEWLLARRAVCEPRHRASLVALIRGRRTELRAVNGQVRRELAAHWPGVLKSARRVVAHVRTSDFGAAVAGTGAKLLKALRAVHSRRDGAAMHRARIRAKRVRYLLEPVRGVDVRVAEAVAALVHIQDDFGHFHDREAIRNALAEVAAAAGDGSARGAMATTIAGLNRVARAEQRELFKHCERNHLHRNATTLGRALRTVATVVRRTHRGRKA